MERVPASWHVPAIPACMFTFYPLPLQTFTHCHFTKLPFDCIPAPQVLEEPMLSAVASEAAQADASGWHWLIKPHKCRVRCACRLHGARRAVVAPACRHLCASPTPCPGCRTVSVPCRANR
jgi:hypothetical protein